MHIEQEVYKVMSRKTKVVVKELIFWINKRETINSKRAEEGTLLDIRDKPQPGKFKRMDNSILVAAIDEITALIKEKIASSEDSKPEKISPTIENK